MADSTPDSDLVSAFLQSVAKYGVREVSRMVDGITPDDISRWRRGDWKRLSAKKRRVLTDFLEGLQGGAEEAETSDPAAHAYEMLWASVRAAMGKEGGVDRAFVEDQLTAAITKAKEWGWDPAPLYEMLGRVRSGDV